MMGWDDDEEDGEEREREEGSFREEGDDLNMWSK
jgi:hypothetical protein